MERVECFEWFFHLKKHIVVILLQSTIQTLIQTPFHYKTILRKNLPKTERGTLSKKKHQNNKKAPLGAPSSGHSLQEDLGLRKDLLKKHGRIFAPDWFSFQNLFGTCFVGCLEAVGLKSSMLSLWALKSCAQMSPDVFRLRKRPAADALAPAAQASNRPPAWFGLVRLANHGALHNFTGSFFWGESV